MAQQREVILPRTIVPEYLDVTPLGVQVRHEPNFDLDRLPQRHEKDLVGLLTERMNDIAGTHAPRRLDAGVSRQIDRYLDSL